jgi:hypothetical protein
VAIALQGAAEDAREQPATTVGGSVDASDPDGEVALLKANLTLPEGSPETPDGPVDFGP